MEQIASCRPVRVLRGYREGCRTDAADQAPIPAVDGRRADQVWPVQTAGAGVRSVGRDRDVERQPALQGRDAAELPASEGRVKNTLGSAEQRQFVEVMSHKTVTN